MKKMKKQKLKISFCSLIALFSCLCLTGLKAEKSVFGERSELSGEGTSSSPYLIKTLDDLNFMTDKVNSSAEDGEGEKCGGICTKIENCFNSSKTYGPKESMANTSHDESSTSNLNNYSKKNALKPSEDLNLLVKGDKHPFSNPEPVVLPAGASWIDGTGSIPVWYFLTDEDATLVIGGSGDMPNLSSADDQPWKSARESITYVQINADVTGISDYAFYGFENLTTANVCNDIVSIGNEAFALCKKLMSVGHLTNLVNIGNYAFRECEALLSFTCYSALKSIGEGAFSKCKSIESFYILPGATVQKSAFEGCDKLDEITLPSDMVDLPESIFKDCYSLTVVKLPSTLETIGKYAFYNCSALKTIVIPENVVSISDYAFYSCSELQTLTVKSENPPLLSGSYSIPSTVQAVVVPFNAVSNYTNDEKWGVFSSKISYFYSVGSVLPSDFPNTSEEAWSNKNGNKLYLYNSDTQIKTGDEPISLSAILDIVDGAYITKTMMITWQFVLNDQGIVTKIIATNGKYMYESLNGEYLPPLKIADLVLTNPSFPTSAEGIPTNALTNEHGAKLYLDTSSQDSKLVFDASSLSGGNFDVITKTIVDTSSSGYTCLTGDGARLTFNMDNDGNLATIQCADSTYPLLNGEYYPVYIHDFGSYSIQFYPWSGGSEGNTLPSEAGDYYLVSDITLPATWAVPSGEINLCLNGHVIKLADEVTGSVISMNVSSDSIFNLYDFDNTTIHYFSCDEATGAWSLDEALGEESDNSLAGGCITGGSSSAGGAIYVGLGTFNFYGGNLVGNKADKTKGSDGGAVALKGTMNMFDGNIVGNYARHNSGAISLISGSGATLNLFDGCISSNSASYIGAIGVQDGCFFNMDGGLICDNLAIDDTQGTTGGVAVLNGGTFTMRAGTITRNIALSFGGGVTVQGTFIMVGGEITCNTTGTVGGGVYVDGRNIVNSSFFVGGSAVIAANSSDNGEEVTPNNVYLCNGKTITIGTKTSIDEGNGVFCPTEDMLIGISLENATGKFTYNPTDEYVERFFSDSYLYTLLFKEDSSSPLDSAYELRKEVTFDDGYEWNNGDEILYGSNYDEIDPTVYFNGEVVYGLTFNFTYYQTFDEGSTWTKLEEKPTGVGSYKVVIDIADPNYEGNSEDNGPILFDINKGRVAKPSEDTSEFIYSGSPISYYVPVDSLYNIEGNLETNAGSYTVTISLSDPDNYEWDDGTTGDLKYDFIIEKAKVAKPGEDTTDFAYNGSSITYNVPTNSLYNVSGNVQTELGDHNVIISLLDPANYEWDDGTTGDLTYTFTINKGKVARPSEDTSEFTYNGSPITYNVPANILYNVSGNVETSAGSYTVTISLSDPANYEWDDGTTSDLTYTFTINKGQIAKPSEDTTDFTYNGSPITYNIPANILYDVSGNVEMYAGNYTVTISLLDPANYEWDDGTTGDLTYTFTINKGQVARPSEDTSEFAYSGSPITYNVPTNILYDVTGNVQSDVGSYTVTISLLDPANYEWDDGTTGNITYTFIINKAKVDKPDENTSSFKYTGSEIVYAVAENDAYTVSGNVKMEPGKYTITISLNDKAHYEWSDGTNEDIVFNWTINKVVLDNPIDSKGNLVENAPIIIDASVGVDPEAVLVVDVISLGNKEAKAPIEESLKNGEFLDKEHKIFGIYDIKLYVNDVQLNFDGTVTLKIAIPEKLVGKTFSVYHIHDGVATPVDFTILEGEQYITIIVDSFSNFVFVGEKNLIATCGIHWGLIAALIVFGGLFVFFHFFMKKDFLFLKSKDKDLYALIDCGVGLLTTIILAIFAKCPLCVVFIIINILAFLAGIIYLLLTTFKKETNAVFKIVISFCKNTYKKGVNSVKKLFKGKDEVKEVQTKVEIKVEETKEVAPKKEEGATLKQTIAKGLKYKDAIISKHEISSWLGHTYKDGVECHERGITTAPGRGKNKGFPLADTHYAIGKNGKKVCFAFVYQLEETNSVFMLLKMNKSCLKDVESMYPRVELSAFPKTHNDTKWYIVFVDDVFKDKIDLYALLDFVYKHVFEDDEAGLGLKDSINLTYQKSGLEITKAEIADYISTLKDVEVNRRALYARPGRGKEKGFPLADTHYRVREDGKKVCFAYVYELDNGNCFMLLKLKSNDYEELNKYLKDVRLSAFPKTHNSTKWYTAIIDKSFVDKNQVYKLLDFAYDHILDE